MGWGWTGTVSGTDTEATRKGETDEIIRLRLATTASAKMIGWPLRTWRENPSAFGNYHPRTAPSIETPKSVV